jgi:hypothetical protein
MDILNLMLTQNILNLFFVNYDLKRSLHILVLGIYI